NTHTHTHTHTHTPPHVSASLRTCFSLCATAERCRGHGSPCRSAVHLQELTHTHAHLHTLHPPTHIYIQYTHTAHTHTHIHTQHTKCTHTHTHTQRHKISLYIDNVSLDNHSDIILVLDIRL